MSDLITFEIKGFDNVLRNLRQVGRMLPLEVGRAMREEAEIEMTEAKRRTPVKTDALRASGHVEGPSVSWHDIVVRLAFGGPSVPYAFRVHEDLEMFHRVGQAKFLESVLLESRPYLAARIARRAHRIFERRGA